MSSQTLTIYQHNVNRSNTTQTLLLDSQAAGEATIIALQEPWLNTANGKTKTKKGYFVVLPPQQNPRVALLVSDKIGTDSWTPLFHNTGDLVTIQIQTPAGTISIHNCYNPSGPTSHRQEGTIPALREALVQTPRDTTANHIVVGDFNLHHPKWGGNTTQTQHIMADKLIDTIAEAHLQLALEPGTITWERHMASCQTLDLVFVSLSLQNLIQECQALPEETHSSDHIPLRTTLCINLQEQTGRGQRKQWKTANWAKIQNLLTQDTNQLNQLPLNTREHLDTLAYSIQSSIQRIVEEAVPTARPSNYAKMAWTQECKDATKLARRRRREWRDSKTEWSHKQYLEASHARSKIVRREQNLAWRRLIKEVTEDPKKVWKMARWAREGANQGHQLPHFPSLADTEHNGDTNEGKAAILAKHFFPNPREADLSDIQHTQLPPQFQMEVEVHPKEVEGVLRKLPSNKAPGPDQIPNLLLKECREQLAPILAKLFTVCLRMAYHPKAFKHSTTVVLRKPQKPDYTKTGAYRPIALLNTIAKVLEAVVAKRMSKETEERKLLPEEQMGARPGRSTTSALDLITEQVRTIWKTRPGAVASMLCLDISGAFDKVSHQRLLYNIRMKGFPDHIVGFIQSFLQDRTTCLRLGEFMDQPRPQNTGIPQGSTLSPILFLFFASTLLPILHEGNTSAMGFVDDSNILTYSMSTEDNCRQLEKAHQKCKEWARRHGAEFAPQKYQLIHFTRSRKHNLKATVQIQGFNGEPLPSLRLLGVWVDTKLKWGPHIKQAATRGAQQMQSLQRLCKSTWGASFQRARHLYTAVVRPTITFGCQVWSSPEGTQGYCRNLTKPIEKIQREALRNITGAYKSVATAVLEREANITPLHLYTQDLARQASKKQDTQPAYQYIRDRCREIQRQAQAGRRTRNHATPTQTRQEEILQLVQGQETTMQTHLGCKA